MKQVVFLFLFLIGSLSFANSYKDDAKILDKVTSTIVSELKSQNSDILKRSALAVFEFHALEKKRDNAFFNKLLYESLLAHTYSAGYNVVDLKCSQFADRVVALQKYNITHVLKGSYSQYRSGYTINARVVDIYTLQVVSSVQIFVSKQAMRKILKKSQLYFNND